MKPKLVIVGGGGHAKVIIDICCSLAQHDVVGYTSLDADNSPTSLSGYSRIGSDNILPDLRSQGVSHAFIAIGDNTARAKCTRTLEELGFTFVTLISSHAIVSRHSVVGPGTAVFPGAIINAGTHIGDGVIVNTNATVDHDCDLGAFSHVGPSATLTGHVHTGECCFIGAGATVLPNRTIGANSTVGAGAVVHRDVAPGTTVVGVPASLLKRKGTA